MVAAVGYEGVKRRKGKSSLDIPENRKRLCCHWIFFQ